LYFRKGSVFVEPANNFWTALGGRKVLSQGLSTWNPLKLVESARETSRRMTSKGVTGNLKGEGLTQGGVAIFDASGNVRFVYKEMTGYQIPRKDMETVMDVIDGE
jgi:hypothetical protein